MIDFERLTDEEVALLTFAVEKEVDGWRMMKKSFLKVSEKTVKDLRVEYQRRLLSWDDYYNED